MRRAVLKKGSDRVFHIPARSTYAPQGCRCPISRGWVIGAGETLLESALSPAGVQSDKGGEQTAGGFLGVTVQDLGLEGGGSQQPLSF